MKINLKQRRGITLIALVITIVVLLILAGVTIAMLTGENGILGKATTAKAKSAEEEARERVNLMLADWKMENAVNGVSLNDFLTTDTYKTNRESQNVINVEPDNKNYFAIVDINGIKYDVEISGEKNNEASIIEINEFGKRISVSTEEINYAFKGNNIEITVVVTAPIDDKIDKIEKISDNLTIGTIEGIGTNTARTTYIVSTNSNSTEYSYKVTTKNKKSQEYTRKIQNILDAPIIKNSITTTAASIKLNTEKIKNDSNYPDKANVKFKYYYKLSTAQSYTEFPENNITTDVKAGQKYSIKVTAYINDDESNFMDTIEERTIELTDTLEVFEYLQDAGLSTIKDLGVVLSGNTGYTYPETNKEIFQGSLGGGCGYNCNYTFGSEFFKKYKGVKVGGESAASGWAKLNLIITYSDNTSETYELSNVSGKSDSQTFIKTIQFANKEIQKIDLNMLGDSNYGTSWVKVNYLKFSGDISKLN